jgi:hypothetical protein
MQTTFSASSGGSKPRAGFAAAIHQGRDPLANGCEGMSSASMHQGRLTAACSALTASASSSAALWIVGVACVMNLLNRRWFVPGLALIVSLALLGRWAMRADDAAIAPAHPKALVSIDGPAPSSSRDNAAARDRRRCRRDEKLRVRFRGFPRPRPRRRHARSRARVHVAVSGDPSRRRDARRANFSGVRWAFQASTFERTLF